MVGQECFTEALLEGASKVFETMIYMTVEECNDNYEGIDGPALLASITFEGEYEGCLGICCSMDCAREITANMRGNYTADELSDEQVTDAMGEVANMVLGAVKANVADAVGDLHVSIPTVTTGSEIDHKLGADVEEVSITVSIDDFMAILTLLYKEHSKQAD